MRYGGEGKSGHTRGNCVQTSATERKYVGEGTTRHMEVFISNPMDTLYSLCVSGPNQHLVVSMAQFQ